MHRTLLFIPHEIAGIPVCGVGWLLAMLVGFIVVRLVLAHRAQQSIGDIVSSEGLLWGGIAAAIVFVLPMVELKNVNGDPVGIAVRGYGVFLVLGIASAIGLAAVRAQRYGVNPEIIFSVAPWAFIAGILGARIFYVIQYFERFQADTLAQTLRNMLMFNEGGLVVYGSFIGGFLAVSYFVIRNKLSYLTLGDIIVPCLFLGVFFGRIGCLMNGCCYGGRCAEDQFMALHFPPGSPVYNDQLATGELLGLKIDMASGEILSVAKVPWPTNAASAPAKPSLPQKKTRLLATRPPTMFRKKMSSWDGSSTSTGNGFTFRPMSCPLEPCRFTPPS